MLLITAAKLRDEEKIIMGKKKIIIKKKQKQKQTKNKKHKKTRVAFFFFLTGLVVKESTKHQWKILDSSLDLDRAESCSSIYLEIVLVISDHHRNLSMKLARINLRAKWA